MRFPGDVAITRKAPDEKQAEVRNERERADPGAADDSS